VSDLLPPGNQPAPSAGDDPRSFPDFFASDMWPALWPRLVFSYANSGARDADLAGLGPTDRAFAFLEDSKTLWRWTGTAWALAAPWVQTGSTGFSPGNSAVAAGGTVDVTITFPVPFIDAGYIPSVMTSFQGGRLTPAVVARSAASMQIRFFNNSTSAATTGATIYWTATRVL